MTVSVELSQQNEFIKQVARDLGFEYHQDGSDESWSRFVLTTHVPVKTEPDSNTNAMSNEIDIGLKQEPPTSSKHSRSVQEQICRFSCESCEKTFPEKCLSKR
eukprot:89637_1